MKVLLLFVMMIQLITSPLKGTLEIKDLTLKVLSTNLSATQFQEIPQDKEACLKIYDETGKFLYHSIIMSNRITRKNFTGSNPKPEVIFNFSRKMLILPNFNNLKGYFTFDEERFKRIEIIVYPKFRGLILLREIYYFTDVNEIPSLDIFLSSWNTMSGDIEEEISRIGVPLEKSQFQFQINDVLNHNKMIEEKKQKISAFISENGNNDNILQTQ